MIIADTHLDIDLFRRGFDDANAQLDAFPPAWARHHASTIMANKRDTDDAQPSYTRGYRAALYGYLRHSSV
ncbi:hypothetical protein VZC37_24525 [Gordonia sp. LSe1-13]|uniref:Uncharacterized protein n=1 Tax=Gordonia sesuvii TaxID=3116777 RepID=A0ABU7MKG5_9ACTN|nr:hypothetical protein [Gordonia sp. LSe1-13]